MHYTCQLVPRLFCSVCERFVLRMFTYMPVHFSMCALVITSNRRNVFVNTQEPVSICEFCFSIHSDSAQTFI